MHAFPEILKNAITFLNKFRKIQFDHWTTKSGRNKKQKTMSLFLSYSETRDNKGMTYVKQNRVGYIHDDSIKSKPNCLCHIYLIPDHIISKLSRCLENSTNNTIPECRNICFFQNFVKFPSIVIIFGR